MALPVPLRMALPGRARCGLAVSFHSFHAGNTFQPGVSASGETKPPSKLWQSMATITRPWQSADSGRFRERRAARIGRRNGELYPPGLYLPARQQLPRVGVLNSLEIVPLQGGLADLEQGGLG